FIGRAALGPRKEKAQAFTIELRLSGKERAGDDGDRDAGQKARADPERLLQEVGQGQRAPLDVRKHRLSESRTLEQRGDLPLSRLGAAQDLLQLLAHAAAEEVD